MKLILHVGLPKTGSSFLQSFLYEKKNLLAQNSIHFPVGQRLNEDNIFKAGNAKYIHELIQKNRVDEIISELEKYMKEAIDKNCINILLSHEGFYSSIPRLFENDKFKFWLDTSELTEIDAIIFLRNPYDLLLSKYKQKCRTGKRISPVQFLKNDKALDQIPNIFKFAKASVHVKLHYINYDKHKHSLKFIFINCMFQIANIPLKDFNFDYNKKVNQSLTLNQIKILQFIALFHEGCAVKFSPIIKKYFNFKQSSKQVKEFNKLTRKVHQDKIRNLVFEMNINLPVEDKIKIS